jgi:hypothetical protein
MRRVLILRIIVTLAIVLLSSQLLAARELTDKEKKVISLVNTNPASIL